jgi:hypothetical protein
MQNLPSWLPPIIKFDDTLCSSLDEYLCDVFGQFQTNWQTTPLLLNGKPVIYDGTTKNALGYPEGFWHIMSHKSPHTTQRIPDFIRCERILWLRAIIEGYNWQEPLISLHTEPKKNKRGKTVYRDHLFLDIENFCHLVILEQEAHAYFLVSSFPIGEGSKKCMHYSQRKKRPRKQTGVLTK